MRQGEAQSSSPLGMLYLLRADLCMRCVFTSRACFSAAFELPACGLFFEQAVGRESRKSKHTQIREFGFISKQAYTEL